MPSSMYLLLFAMGILSYADSIANNDTVTEPIIIVKNDTLTTKLPPTTTEVQPTIKLTTVMEPSTTNMTTTVPTPTTPPPHKMDYVWTVEDNVTNHICLMAHIKIQLDVPYTNTSNKVVMTHVAVPGNATGTGSCNSSDPSIPQILILNWGSDNATNNVTLKFVSNTTTKEFWLDSIDATLTVDNKTFPNFKRSLKVITMVNSSKHFVTPVHSSFSCQSLLNIPAKLVPDVNHTAYFTLDHFQLQAFMNSTKNDFSSAIYCEGDNTPDLVPILVGCTLVALVVVVLGVYLWGRRRSQARGYLSM